MEDVIWQRDVSSLRYSEDFYSDIDLETANRNHNNNNSVLIVDVDEDELPMSRCGSCIERLIWSGKTLSRGEKDESTSTTDNTILNNDINTVQVSSNIRRALRLNEKEKRDLVGDLSSFETTDSELEGRETTSAASSRMILDEAVNDLGICPSQISSTSWSTIPVSSSSFIVEQK